MLDIPDTRSILIVEDDDALRERLAAAMQKRGFQTRTARSVAEGKTAISAGTPCFAVIDLRLVVGSGLDVVRLLEKKDPNARAIVLTGYANIPTAVAAVRLGATDYIAKPATADEIVDVLLSPKNEPPDAPANPIAPEEARLKHIKHIFHEADENVSQAARMLQMHRRTLQRILRRNGVVANAKQ